MQGSLYPDGVLVDRSALRRTELTKATEILRSRIDLSSRGIVSGGAVTVNTDTSKVDVAQFSGFSPNGEFIESAGASLALSLSDYTLDTINYVVAVYTEINDKNQPHESNGSVYPTRARSFYRVRIYTEAEYDALPYTDSNLANDSRDRSLLLAKVKAGGSGVALATSDITGPVVYSNIMTATPFRGVNITGTMILTVSPDTLEGDGTLTYDASANEFTWASSGGVAGAGVVVSDDDQITLYDGSVVSSYIQVQVIFSQLPTSGTLTDTITIDNLYSQEIPRLTAEDHFHRNLIGTGIVSENNPHGNSLEDFEGASLGLLDEHQDVMHCNGIWKGSSTTCLRLAVDYTVPAVDTDTLNITQPLTGDLYYVNGSKLNTISASSLYFGASDFVGKWGSDERGSKLFQIFVDDNGTTYAHLKAYFPIPTRNVTGVWITDANVDYPDGTATLQMVVGVSDLTFTFGNGSPVTIPLTIPTPGDESNISVIRLYARSGINWIDLAVNRDSSGAFDSDADLPAAGTYSDTITFLDSPDTTQNMCIGSVAYWYSAVGTPRGYLGIFSDYNSSAFSRSVVDRRPWGTLNADNISDDFLKDYIYDANNEFHSSGVLLNRQVSSDTGQNFGFEYTAPGFSPVVRGGSYYLKGRKRSRSFQILTLGASKTYLVYINTSNTITFLNITDDFGGSIKLGLAYLAGTTLDRNEATVTYNSDSTQYAERGVPLYVVTTDGTGVTAYYDIMRNVNGPVDPWTVASRSSALAAFDSLYAAFLWADVYTDADFIGIPTAEVLDIKLVGKSEIETNITQPSRVNVSGIRPYTNTVASSSNEVVVSVDSESTQAWTLGEKCKVDGVYLVNAHVVAGATHPGVIFGISSGCEISNCYFNSDGEDVAFCRPTGNITNIKLLKNEVYITTSFYGDRTGSSRTTAFCNISNNNISVSGDTTKGLYANSYEGVISVYGNSATIVDNYVVLDSGASGTNKKNAITYYGGSSAESVSFVKSNKVYLGSVGLSGVYLFGTLRNLTVSENLVKSYGSFRNDDCCGVFVGYGVSSRVRIVDNIFDDLGGCVLYFEGGAFTSCSNISICRNKISGGSLVSASRGIYFKFSGQEISGVDINNNLITGLERDAAATDTPSGITDDKIYGIQFLLDGSGMDKCNGVDICKNIISELQNDVSPSSSLGISFSVLDCSASPDLFGISINENNISNISATSYQYGVEVWNAVVGILGGVSVSNNKIKISPVSSVTSTGIEIYSGLLNAYIVHSEICSNNILVGDTTGVDTGYGIWTESSTGETVGSLRISDNVIVSNTEGIRVDAYDSVINSNSITSLGVGIYSIYCSRTKFSGNSIKVYSFQEVSASHGSGCIQIRTGSDNFAISNCELWLYGGSLTSPGTSALLDYSSNLRITECTKFSVDGVNTYQNYGSVSTANAAYHVNLDVGTDLDAINVSFSNCVLNNRVFDVRSTSTSHGLYFVGTSVAPTVCSGQISVTNNTIYWPKEIATGGQGWRTAGAATTGAFAVYCPFPDIDSGGEVRHFVRYIGNKVVSVCQTAGVSSSRAPNASFQSYPTFSCDGLLGTVYSYSNTYTVHSLDGSSAPNRTSLSDWGLDTVNS